LIHRHINAQTGKKRMVGGLLEPDVGVTVALAEQGRAFAADASKRREILAHVEADASADGPFSVAVNSSLRAPSTPTCQRLPACSAMCGCCCWLRGPPVATAAAVAEGWWSASEALCADDEEGDRERRQLHRR
jgi:hypothetical protein